MGMGEKPRNIQKTNTKNKGKNSSVWLPSHPPVSEMKADCFPVSENTKTSRFY